MWTKLIALYMQCTHRSDRIIIFASMYYTYHVMHIISMNNQLPSSNILVTLGSKQTFINFFFFFLKEQAFEGGGII